MMADENKNPETEADPRSKPEAKAETPAVTNEQPAVADTPSEAAPTRARTGRRRSAARTSGPWRS